MSLFADPGKYFYGSYKRSVLSKKYKVYLAVYPSEIRAMGFMKFIEADGWNELDLLKNTREEGFSSEPTELCVAWEDIHALEEVNCWNCRALRIACDVRSLSSKRKTIIILPEIDSVEAVSEYQKARDRYFDKKQREKERKEAEEKEEAQAALQQELEKLLRKRFFEECVAFHTQNTASPFYELMRDDYQLQLVALYVDREKALNFLQIDGTQKQESNGKIPYDEIHYYDRGGSIHYVSNIKGSVRTSGGSYRSATFSKLGTLYGGWRYGLEGMVAGALLTYEPAELTMPTSQFSLETQTQKIDDRNVLLNYYSEAYRQYIDIELPEGAYNFLQTYLPRKKRDIVMELEKQEAVRSAEPVRSSGLPDAAGEDAFETRVKKLKMMYDNGMLTQEEYNEEKRALLSSI